MEVLSFVGAKVQSCTITGLEGALVEVAVDIADGRAAFSIVGLSHAASNALQERVCSAITHSGGLFPHKHITVNLTPTNVCREGFADDLPIAIGILLAPGQNTARPA